MAYKLVIEDTVKVPVKFTLNNAGKPAAFSFSLICERLAQEEIAAFGGDKSKVVSDFLIKVIRNWAGQTLVIDEEGTPAEFSEESLQLMLGISGVPELILAAYFKEVVAKEKN